MLNRLLIASGGTGGHIFPALAVAKRLQSQGVDIVWVGTHQGLESKIIPEKEIPLYTIDVTGLRRKGWLPLIRAPFQLVKALYQAFRIIRRYNPDVVLGMGAFVSGPSGLAAWLLRKRLVLHEQNAMMGLTNRILSRIANTVLTGFPEVPNAKVECKYVGNPVREDILALPKPEKRFKARESKEVNLLIFGGSRGASSFNRILPKALSELSEGSRLNIWHQTGTAEWESTKLLYQQEVLEVRVDPFIDDMAAAYGWADLVICRAGASTVAELSAVGVASVLVPYPHAVDDHQTMNACFLVDVGGAVLLPDHHFTIDAVKELLSQLIIDKSRLRDMAKAAGSLRKINVIDEIIGELNRV